MNVAAISLIVIFSIIPFSFSESNVSTCETKDTMVVTTDRIHYSKGDTVLVSGCLSEDIKHEDLYLSAGGIVGENGDNKILLSTVIKANPDGTFSHQISTKDLLLDYNLWISVVAGSHEETVEVKFSRFGQLCGSVSNENPIEVFTDKENYQREDKISVYGCLAEVAYTKGINIIVYNGSGNEVAADTIIPQPDFTFETEFEIDDSFAVDGIYIVEADAAGLYQTSKAIVVPEFGHIVLIVLTIGFFSGVFVSLHKRFQIFFR